MEAQVRFRCYYCHRLHTVDSTAAGKKGRCVCGKLMVVPAPPPTGAARGADTAPPPTAPPAGMEGTDGPRGKADETAAVPLMFRSDWEDAAEPKDGSPASPPRGPWGAGGGAGAVHRGGVHRGAAEAFTVGGPEDSGSSAPSLVVGAFEVFLSIPVLALGLAHVLHEKLASMELLYFPDANYLNLPEVFWSTMIFSLAGALLLDGWLRIRARRQ